MKHKESPGSNGAPSQSPRPRIEKKMDAILVTKLQKEGLSSSYSYVFFLAESGFKLLASKGVRARAGTKAAAPLTLRHRRRQNPL